jgi:transcriptional regulator with XRE-family HTH domain
VAHKTLKQARDAKGWTQEQLAAKSGVDQRVISKIERGAVGDVMNSTAAALEEALGVKRGTLAFGAAALEIAS